MVSPKAAPSIRRRLLGYLLLPLLLLMIANIWADHRSFVTPIYTIFDRALARSVFAIAAHVQQAPDGHLYVDVAETAPGSHPPPSSADVDTHPGPALHFSPGDHPADWSRRHPHSQDRFFFRVSLPDGQTLWGDPNLPIASSPARDNLAYANSHYQGFASRVVSYYGKVGGRPLTVTVAETVHRRDRIVHRLDTIIGVSDSVQLLLVLGLCLFGITVALRPLNRLLEQISHRKPQSLQPLPLEPIPAEVRPLVASLNTLLVTVRDATHSQQHFLTNAAHQLRTPLTGLKAQLEVLKNEIQDSAQRERIALLQGSVDRLAHTAHQLLALARAEPSAHGPGDVVTIQLDALVGTVAGSMLDRALGRNIDLGAECESASVYGVHWLLHELLINLVDNAIHHTPEGGNITLRCGVHEGKPYLEVEDSGPGIPVAERERVRKRFYRAAGSDGQSSGLGLAIVDEIARSHRARFHILDARDGRGACMRIEFPAMA